MKFRTRSREQSHQQRKRNLQQHLRIERLEDRIVLAGDSPIAFNDVFEAAKGQPLEVAVAGVLANDTDAEGDLLSAIEFRGPSHGTLELESSGAFVYTPDPNFEGIDGFIYRADDGTSSSLLAVVTIHVNDSHSAPVAIEDSYVLLEDQSLDIDATMGVLANDSDADADPLTAVLVEGPANGTLTLNDDGSFTYTPAENFNGSDSFSYQASDGSQLSEEVVVAISVTAVNDVPVATNDFYETNEDQALVVGVESGVLANDSDSDGSALTALLVDGTADGSLSLNPDGSFSYTPNANFNGIDAFSYQVSDGTTTGDLVVVELVVNAINDAPTIVDDAYTTHGSPLVVDEVAGVLANDSDIDGDLLTAELVEGPANGTLVFNADGSFTYTPNDGYAGPDAFSYVASDGVESVQAMVSIQVPSGNVRPVAKNDKFLVDPAETFTVDAARGVLANDTGSNSNSLEAELFRGPQHGTLTLHADGSFEYAPMAGYSGTDAFFYRATAGELSSRLAIVQLNIASSPSDTAVSGSKSAVPKVDVSGPSEQTIADGAAMEHALHDLFFDSLGFNDRLTLEAEPLLSMS